jgi:multidrug efflux system membrane fusion protein
MRAARMILLACLGVIIAAAAGDVWRRRYDVAPLVVAAPRVPVSIGTSERGDVPLTVSGLGTVQATNTVTIRTRVEGQLLQLHFTGGQLIKAGDLLAEIDPRPYQAALDQGKGKLAQDEAALANSKLSLGRDSDLASKQFFSQQVLDNQRSAVQQLEAAIEQDQAAIASAQTQLSYTAIASPIDGRTGIRLVDAGNILHPADAARDRRRAAPQPGSRRRSGVGQRAAEAGRPHPGRSGAHLQPEAVVGGRPHRHRLDDHERRQGDDTRPASHLHPLWQRPTAHGRAVE